MRATWDEATEIIAAANAYTAKTYGPDRVFGFSPIPAMSMISYAAGARYLQLLGGVTGFITGCLLTWYMNSYDYPLIVGGKPYWSVIFPFPIIYECTILLAAFGTFFGQFIFNRLPRHNHPLFDLPNFARISDDTFMIVLEARDPQFHLDESRNFLQSLGGQEITVIRD